MSDFNPFDMDFDGDIDGFDFLGFDYLIRHVFQPNRDEEDDDGWDGEDQADDDEESEVDEEDGDSREDETWDDD